MNKVTLKVELEVTDQMIDDALSTAFEGGINYWCRKVGIVKLPDVEFQYTSDIVSRGGILEILEMVDEAFPDSEDNEWHMLNKDAVLKGFQKMFENMDITTIEEYDTMQDADTADQIVQFAIFGQIVYG